MIQTEQSRIDRLALGRENGKDALVHASQRLATDETLTRLHAKCELSQNVGGLAERTGISQKNISNHLNQLRIAGLVYNHRAGQHNEYELADGRVDYQRDPTNGHFRLTIRSRGGGVAVTIEVGNASQKD